MGTPNEVSRFGADLQPREPALPRWTEEKVMDIHHWTDRIFSFKASRPADFRFSAGHYARVGLPDANGDLVWRPLSMVSSPQEAFLEFVAIMVPDGNFSRCLGGLSVDAPVAIDKSCFGFLTLDQLAAGDDLWLLASGTGIGPFVAMLRDSQVWQRFRRIVVVHSVRRAVELVYREFLAGLAKDRGPGFSYLPVVTRDGGGAFAERIPALLADGRLEAAAGVPLRADTARAMVCGNPAMTRDLRELLSTRGFAAGRRGVAGQMAFEKYW